MKLIIATIVLVMLMLIASHFKDVVTIDVCMALAYGLGILMGAM
jgi:hypothetical protein